MLDDSRLKQVLERILRTNQSPEEACRDFPELLPEVRRRLQAGSVIPQFTTVAPADSARTPLATPPPAPGAPLGGARVGRYQIEEEIAHGGMGVVFRAHDFDLGRTLALKVMLEHHQGSPDIERRFRDEAQITGQLQHPGIPPIHELGTLPDGRPFLAMKLIRGRTLADLLRQRPSPSADLPRFVAIFEQICQALAYAHSHQVIHRDLKPGNVMVGVFGEVQLMDWGLAKVLREGRTDQPPTKDAPGSVVETAGLGADDSATQAGAVMGTFAYMAPEQARGEVDRLGKSSDVFGLGAILYHILIGQPPFTGTIGEVKVHAQLGHLQPAYERLQGSCQDDSLIQMARRCLSPRAEDRPGDAGELAAAVRAYLESVQERLRQAEVERAAAEARAAAEVQAREAAQAQAHAEQQARTEAQARARHQRRAQRLTLALAALLAFLACAGVGMGWWLQQQQQAVALRRQQADDKTRQALDQVRQQLEAAWKNDDGAGLGLAKAGADKAVEMAAYADEPFQKEAAEAQQEAHSRLAQWEKNRLLLNEVLNIGLIRDSFFSQTDDKGVLAEGAVLSVEDRLAGAFQRWGVDIDRDPPEDVVARLRAQPDAVVQAVVASLDEWEINRRQNNRPEADRVRLSELADRLDGSPDRREVRRIGRSGTLQNERILAVLVRSCSPYLQLLDAPAGPNIQLLRRHAEELQANAAARPGLSIVTLCCALDGVGEERHAEAVLRAGVTAHPDSAVLLAALAGFLERQHPPRLAEAIECLRALRVQRPGLGTTMARDLLYIGRGAEAQAILADLLRQSPDSPELHNDLGISLLKQGKPDEAVSVYRKLIKSKPDFPSVYLNLGAALHLQGKLDDAEAAYRAAIARRPNYGKAYYNLGFLLADQRRLDEAETAYRKAIEVQPDFAYPYNNLANLLGGRGQRDQALAYYQKALELQPDYAEAYCNLGKILCELKKWAEAEAACRKAIGLKPNFAEAYNNLGNALQGMKKPHEAVAAYRKAIDIKPNYALGYANVGHSLSELKEWDAAVVAYRQAIKFKPDFANAYYDLGTALAALRKRDEAVAAFGQAVHFKPDFAEAYNNLGAVLLELGKLEDAAAAYRKAIEIKKDYGAVYHNLGIVLQKQRKFKDAEAALRKAVELQPDDVASRLRLGAVLRDQRKLFEAEAAFRKAIELKGNDADAYNGLGSTLRNLQKPLEAEAAFRQAINLKPEFSEAYFNLGIALGDQGKRTEAMAAYRKAIAPKVEYGEAWSNLGIDLQQSGQTAEAEEAYQKASRFLPNDALPFNNLGVLLMLQGRFDEALVPLKKALELRPPGHPRHAYSRNQVLECQRWIALDGKLAAVLDGAEKPDSALERIEYGRLCKIKKLYFAAARLHREAFAADPKLAEAEAAANRYAAACCAAIAGCGLGNDADRLDDKERALWRQQALDWLRADLASWSKLLADDKNRGAAAVQQVMTGWQNSPETRCVRDKDSLSKLAENERKKWQELWDDVAELLKRARGG
jgi:eukaryotic-like serine/threonine-protein kinase